MHALRDAGADVVSVGKLHFRSSDDDNGFSEELAPMHILNGKGGVSMLLRWSDEEPVNAGQWGLYLEQSQRGREPLPGVRRRDLAARDRLAPAPRGAAATGPWVLFVSYVSPHPPFTVPQALLDTYPAATMPLPPRFRPDERPTHPALAHLRRIMGFQAMTDEAALRRIAACYYALVTHLDREIGTVMRAAESLGLLVGHARRVHERPRRGARRARPVRQVHPARSLGGDPARDVRARACRAGRVVDTPVSHVDLYPTLVESAGLPPDPAERELLGRFPPRRFCVARTGLRRVPRRRLAARRVHAARRRRTS